jgi:hypothetical protein
MTSPAIEAAFDQLCADEQWLKSTPPHELIEAERWGTFVESIAGVCAELRRSGPDENANALERRLDQLLGSIPTEGAESDAQRRDRRVSVSFIVTTVGVLARGPEWRSPTGARVQGPGGDDAPPDEADTGVLDLATIRVLREIENAGRLILASEIMGRTRLPGRTRIREILQDAEGCQPPLVERPKGPRSGYRLTKRGREDLRRADLKDRREVT